MHPVELWWKAMFPPPKGTAAAGQAANPAPNADMSGMFFKVLHWISLLFIVALSFTILALVVGATDQQIPFHIENTILQKYDSDSLVNTYVPVSNPPTEDSVINNFYGCLLAAEVGVDNVYNCPTTDVTSYKTCIAGFANNSSKVKRMVTLIRSLLSDLKINDNTAVEMQNLPNYLAASTTDVLTAQLTSNDARTALKQQLVAQSTSLSIQILDIITQTEKMSGLSVCTDAVVSTQLTEYSAAYDLSTAFDRLWKCSSDIVITNSIQKRAYDRCIPLSAWPAKDVVQTPYTDTLLGSYNKYFTAWIGAWLLASFAVYTMPLLSSPPTENGKPAYYFAQAGKIFVGFGFVWNLAAIITVLIYGFSPASNLKNEPMSIQTLLLTLLFSVTASIYIGRELYELFFLSEGSTPNIFPKFSAPRTSTRVLNGQRFHSIQAFINNPNKEQPLSDEQYTPLVVPVWNDAFVFVDILLFLSVIGTTNDTVTIDLVVVAFCILATALSNSALVRLLQDCYVDVPATLSAELQVPTFVLRVMSMIATIVGLLFFIIAMIIVAMRFGNQVITWYIICTMLISQVYWLVYMVVLEMYQTISLQTFFRSMSAFFSFNVVIRCVFITILASTINNEYNATIGDSDSVKSLLNLINTESIVPIIPSYVTY